MSNVLTNNTFCSDGSETILRNIKVKQKILTKKEIEDVYEIERCKQFIKDNSFKKVFIYIVDYLNTLVMLLDYIPYRIAC